MKPGGREDGQQPLEFSSSLTSQTKRKSNDLIVLDGSDEDRKPAAIAPKKPRNLGVQLKLTNDKPDPMAEAKMNARRGKWFLLVHPVTSTSKLGW